MVVRRNLNTASLFFVFLLHIQILLLQCSVWLWWCVDGPDIRISFCSESLAIGLFLVGNCAVVDGCCFGCCFVDSLLWLAVVVQWFDLIRIWVRFYCCFVCLFVVACDLVAALLVCCS